MDERILSEPYGSNSVLWLLYDNSENPEKVSEIVRTVKDNQPEFEAFKEMIREYLKLYDFISEIKAIPPNYFGYRAAGLKALLLALEEDDSALENYSREVEEINKERAEERNRLYAFPIESYGKQEGLLNREDVKAVISELKEPLDHALFSGFADFRNSVFPMIMDMVLKEPEKYPDLQDVDFMSTLINYLYKEKGELFNA